MESKGIQHSTQRLDHFCLCGHARVLRVTCSGRPAGINVLRFEMEVIGKSTVEISLNMLLVIITRGGHDRFHELVVVATIAVQEVVPAGVPEPRRSPEFGWDSLAHESLHFGGLCGEANRVCGWQPILAEQFVPFRPAMSCVVVVRAFPGLILLQRHVLRGFAESIFVPRVVSRNERGRDESRDNDF